MAYVLFPWAALLGHSELRRVFPREYGLLFAAVALATTLTIAAALLMPAALHAIAACAALLLVAEAVRSRTARGLEAPLPPGSLAIADSIEALFDRRFYQKRAARLGPVFKMSQFHHRTICVTGIERGHRIFREHADRIGPCPLPFSDEISGGFLRYMDEPTYEKYGPLFRKAFSGPAVQTAAEYARRAARREFARIGNARTGGSEPPGRAIRAIVHDSLTAALFGIVPGSPDYDEMKRLTGAFSEQDLNLRLDARTKKALAALRALVNRRVERMDAGDSDGATDGDSDGSGDALSPRDEPAGALGELRRVDPAMPDDVCVDNLLFVLKIASANMASLLHWIVIMLRDNPDWRDRVRRARPESADSRRLDVVNRFITETLRLAQSEYLYRSVTKDFVFEGHLFPKGWLVRHCVWESHRDPDLFDDPESFDPDRHVRDQVTKQAYSPFGCPHHGCNGVALTFAIARTCIEELGKRDWSATGGERTERDFRHWSHWRPTGDLVMTIRAELDPGAPVDPALPSSSVSV